MNPFISQPHRFVAACMLTALETRTGVDAAEDAVIKFLMDQGTIQESDCPHVEHGCLEHGVVHVNVWDGVSMDASKDKWIEIDPAGDGPCFL
jgi:hypothetical protein